MIRADLHLVQSTSYIDRFRLFLLFMREFLLLCFQPFLNGVLTDPLLDGFRFAVIWMGACYEFEHCARRLVMKACEFDSFEHVFTDLGWMKTDAMARAEFKRARKCVIRSRKLNLVRRTNERSFLFYGTRSQHSHRTSTYTKYSFLPQKIPSKSENRLFSHSHIFRRHI